MTIINWLVSHQFILGGLVIAILDFIFAISPGLTSNGILHSIYEFLKNQGKPNGTT